MNVVIMRDLLVNEDTAVYLPAGIVKFNYSERFHRGQISIKKNYIVSGQFEEHLSNISQLLFFMLSWNILYWM